MPIQIFEDTDSPVLDATARRSIDKHRGVAFTPKPGPSMIPEEDVDDSEIPTIDCDLLLAVKENIQPLARGRRATALSEVFSTPLVHRDAILNRERTRRRMNLACVLEDGDSEAALDAYYDFVHWTIESYPQGHNAESGIIELIEEATRVLKERDLNYYRDNEKYLKLWLLYAEYVERPSLVYAFLLSNDIGSNHASLYENYADELELELRHTEADEMYKLGIARHAEPSTRLKTRHKAFQRRMLRADDSQDAALPLEPATRTPAPSAPRPRRVILGNSNTPTPGPVRQQGAQADDFFSSSTPAPPKPNTRIAVFSDEGDHASPTPIHDNWPDLGTKKTRVKENKREVTKAGDGVPLKGVRKTSGTQSRIVPFEDTDSPAPPSTSKAAVLSTPLPGASKFKTPAKTAIVPFCDETETLEAVPATPALHSSRKMGLGLTPALTLSKNSNMSSEAESLRKDPLKNHTDQ